MNCSSGKVVYRKRCIAKKAARLIKVTGGRPAPGRSKVLRPYQCRECHLWHLTSHINIPRGAVT